MDITKEFELVYYGINYILLTIGFLGLFPKLGIKKYVAFIPYYRIFKLAQSVDREDEGVVFVVSAIVTSFIAPAVALFFEDAMSYISQMWVTKAILGIEVAVIIAVMIYELRIYYAVCDAFGKKASWAIVWLIAGFIPAIKWGYDKKIGNVYNKIERAAPISGVEADESSDGLVVNLESRRVWESFRRKYLLRDIHMNIKPGKMVLLLGGSGSGKTTMINAIIGYEPAKAKILLNGEDVYKQYDKMKYKIAMVPQQDLMRYDDTVLRTLSDAAVLRLPEEVSAKERNKKVHQVLDDFGLAPVKLSEVQKLSGGQKKRLSIAMEFISDPYLFVLDEPDSGLDGVLARDLMTRLREIADQGKIVIVITHSPDRVLDLFDDVIVLAKDANKTGRLVFYGSVDECKEFFGTDKMENVVKMINRKNEGGEGKADELISKYMEVSNGK